MTAIACIGSRDIKRWERFYLESIGAWLAETGYTVISGNAPGADQAFALGANHIDERRVELYLPWPNFEKRWIMDLNTSWTTKQASLWHIGLAQHAAGSAWAGLTHAIRQLFIRNAMIILRHRASPCSAVIAYPDRTKPGWGGTGHGIMCARLAGIPIWMADQHTWLDGSITGYER